jgi:tRNA 2-selenouridine synthase
MTRAHGSVRRETCCAASFSFLPYSFLAYLYQAVSSRMTKLISIADFFSSSANVPVIDVRTPAEFDQGHIPGAFNLPLFSNEERVIVGTTYKQMGREAAILLGFDLTGSKWSGFIRQALEIAPEKKIAVHCWRGGMRSGAMAWAMGMYGFEVYVLEGGYKKYRNWVLRQFERPWDLRVLGGMTGSGKTIILSHLSRLNEQVIDLEGLAQHQGSSFGTMNKFVQPTQEQFENNFAQSLHAFNPAQRIWVEDESVTIGKRVVPDAFWKQMRKAALICIEVPLHLRLEKLVAEYGVLDKDFLTECTERIRKRLGPEQTRDAVQAVRDDRMADFVALLLVYYDKKYRKGLEKRNKDTLHFVQVDSADYSSIAQKLKTVADNISAVTNI